MTTKMRGDQLDVGTGANQVVQLNGSSQLPAVDGSLLTGVASEAYVDTNDRLTINAKTANYTLVLDDENALITMSSSTGALTLTVPTNTSVAFPIGTQILVEQENTDQVTIAGADGSVTLHSAGGLLSTTEQYSTVSLIKKGTNVWLVAGDLA